MIFNFLTLVRTSDIFNIIEKNKPAIPRTEQTIIPGPSPKTQISRPVIIYPADGSTVEGVIIKGAAKPNSLIWAYVNYPEDELKYLSINSYANGGASRVDQNGNFEFALAEACARELTVVVAIVDEPLTTGPFKAKNVSKPITYTNTGKFSEICYRE